MKNFFNYAQHYDLLNHDKNYISECNYIEKLFNYFNSTPHNILDVGCGTGKHAIELSKRGFNVMGIDLSPDMIKIAEQNKLNEDLILKPKVQFRTTEEFQDKYYENSFDSSLSLFHVANYQTSDEDLVKFFKFLGDQTVNKGLIIFDYWFAPAVEYLKPNIRSKLVENNRYKISRDSIPTHFNKEIKILFKIVVEDKFTNQVSSYEEIHSMRPLSPQDLEEFLPEDLKLIKTLEWMTFNTPSLNSWSAVSICQKG